MKWGFVFASTGSSSTKSHLVHRHGGLLLARVTVSCCNKTWVLRDRSAHSANVAKGSVAIKNVCMGEVCVSDAREEGIAYTHNHSDISSVNTRFAESPNRSPRLGAPTVLPAFATVNTAGTACLRLLICCEHACDFFLTHILKYASISDSDSSSPWSPCRPHEYLRNTLN